MSFRLKNKKIDFLILFSLFFFLLSFPLTVQSQEVDNQMANFIQNMPLVNAPLVNIVFNVIRYLLGFLGVIAVVVLIYGGFLWMTARGNEEQVQKAKKTLINGLIGLVIVMLSFTIISFVIRRIKEVAELPTSCTPGEIRGCETCGPEGQWYWDYIRCPGGSGEKFLITKIIPERGPNIRNSVIRIYFNKVVKPDTLDQNDVIVEKTHYSEDRGNTWTPIEPPLPIITGSLILESERVVKFIPEANCPPPNENWKCFNEWSKFKVTVKEGEISSDERLPKPLSCANNKCLQNFWTNDIVDIQSPSVSIYDIRPSQGNNRYIPNNSDVLIRSQATDDSEISHLEFYFNNVLKAVVEEPDKPPPENIYSFTLNTRNLIVGSSHIIKVKAYDINENTSEINHQVIIRAFHCFNGIKDEDEEGIDCGGRNCGVCQGGNCGNGLIDPGEQCDGDNLGGKTCQALGFAGGTLACQPDCTFDTTGCISVGASGRWGDVCQLANVCTEGVTDCSLAQGASCVQNSPTAPCACCCKPDNPDTLPNEDTCQVINLICDPTKHCSRTTPSQTGLCCGCGTDDDKCCQNPPCIGVACKDNCCLPFPAPTDLKIIDPTVNQIKLTWQYSDPENLATHFEVYHKIGKVGDYLLLTTCKIDGSECDPNPDNKFSLTRLGNIFTFIDTTGGFDRTKTYYFKVRAKKGTSTAYSDYTDEVSGVPVGVVVCTINSDCPDKAPCCRQDIKQCITWDFCPAGQCFQDTRCKPPEVKFATHDFWVQPPPAVSGPCLTDVQPRQGYIGETPINLTGREFGQTRGNNQVIFNGTNADYTHPDFSWSDLEIKNTLISTGTPAGLGEVKVRKAGNNSNSLSFRVLVRAGNPSDQCKNPEIPACVLGFDQCNQPTIYYCLPNQNQEDCRCCCQISPNTCRNNLSCIPKDLCSGGNRGLCCGCNNDAQCNGITMGCGFLDPDRCCYPRPIVTSTGLTCLIGNQVGLNTTIKIIFNRLMHHPSLNNSTIQIYREINNERLPYCDQNEERRDNFCYLKGQIINEDMSKFTQYTQSTFYPQGCKLRDNTIYYIKIIGGANGVKSNKGVAMASDYTTNFTTGGPNILCKVEKVEVSPKEVTLRKEGATQVFNGKALDNRDKEVCVTGFNWSLEPVGGDVVSIDPLFGLSTTTTALTKSGQRLLKATYETKIGQATIKVWLGGPQVIEDRTCGPNHTQSPSPFKGLIDVCVNTLISARFDMDMKVPSINTESILIHSCQTNPQGEPVNCTIPINGEIKEAVARKFIFQPTNLFSINTWYRVTLRGTDCTGYNCLMSAGGVILDGDRNGEPGGDYIWFFKTRNSSELCPLASVSLSCDKEKLIHRIDSPDSTNCTATSQVANCNIIDPEDYSWDWQSIPVSPWPAPVVNITPYIKEPWKATATSSNLGITEIKARTEGKTSSFRLTVATIPKVEENYPANNATNICRNTTIYTIFDQEMDEQNFSGNFKIWRTPDVPNGDFSDETAKFSLRFEKIGKKTKVYFIPKNLLTENKTYTILIKKEVRSISPFSEKMANDHLWRFTTGSEICFLDRVIIDVDQETVGIQNKWLFRKATETQNFEAVPLAQNGQKIQEVPGSYEWRWDDGVSPPEWRSSDTTIAQVPSSDGPVQTVTAQNKNGLATITATAEITVSNIPQSPVGTKKSGSALAEVFLCENVWPCKKADWPNCQPYKDTTTNFEFRYCRDAGLPGIEGDLPILKGGSIIGAQEPPNIPPKLKEYLFSVYDGSLSLYYDGEEILINSLPSTIIILPDRSRYLPDRSRYLPDRSGYNNQDYNLYDNTGVVNGTVVSVSGGKFGKYLSFGDSSFLSLTDNLTLKPQTLTLATWVKKGTNKYLFRKGDSTGPTGQGYYLKITPQNKVHFWLYDQNGQKREIISTDSFNPNTWTHLAATYDGRSLKIYINGLLKGETSVAGIKYEGTTALRIGDGNIKLDDIALYNRALSQSEIEELTKAPVKVSIGDVIGFKVFSNFDHLRPEEWFRKYAPGATGAGSSLSVDGYRAYQVGRTIYVGATNVVDPTGANNIYSNIYLISHNDNPKPETLEVFRKIVGNWKFNTNISQENKGKLARDLERLYHLNDIAPLFERYKNKKGNYPKLEAGSYIIGMTTSKWPSWNRDPAFNLAKELEGSLPLDPINSFANRTSCGTPPNQYSCCADCPRNDPQCDETCYNSVTRTYECNSGSHIYQYMVENNGDSYGFYSKFEYSNPDQWQHQCSGLNEVNCKFRHWCEWVGNEPNCACRNKLLNSSFSCFNSKYRPEGRCGPPQLSDSHLKNELLKLKSDNDFKE